MLDAAVIVEDLDKPGWGLHRDAHSLFMAGGLSGKVVDPVFVRSTNSALVLGYDSHAQ